MLVSLHLKNIALVREVEVHFGTGLNILTGETGAGKSIIIGGISAALGAAALKDFRPETADYALAELVFETCRPEAKALLSEHEIPFEEGQIIISRKYQNGRTINRINGETVPASLMRDLTSFLIDIHGQHEHQSLLRPSAPRLLLDRYAAAALGDLPADCAKWYKAYTDAEEERKNAVMDESSRLKQIDLLRYEIHEIEEAALREGEDEELELQYRLMNNSQRILETLNETAVLVSGEDGASSRISRAVRSLSGVSRYDPKLEQLLDQLAELESLSSDFDRSLSDYMDVFAYDEETFRQTEERLDVINRLKVKYGRQISDIKDACETRREELQRFEQYEDYLQSLEKKSAHAFEKLKECAARISVIRKKEASVLQEQITRAMKELNFPDTRFLIEFEDLPVPNGYGQDGIRFLISLNPGIPLRPLQEVASGGELSRIMLAIKAVMADQDAVETLIFDEIDTGISGRTAQKVSEMMGVLSQSHQIICITHLAQIAAMADQHFLIEKSTLEGRAFTEIRRLEENETVEELARILGGASITDTVKQSAAEMRELSRQVKKKQLGN